ncbi:hypothetical protein IAU59_006356 [Kwoniella sp. CBS 9459]
MPVMASSLPPPVVFSHAETLHAIPLPPLASFLVSLHKAEHLIKLNDILDRYRTPKSYHRIDVRLVESSELPPGTPESFTSKERRGSREPVILEEGVDAQAYIAERCPAATEILPREGQAEVKEHEDGRAADGAVPIEVGNVEAEVIEETIDLRPQTPSIDGGSKSKTERQRPAQQPLITEEEEIHDSITVTQPFPTCPPTHVRRNPNPNPEPIPIPTATHQTERPPSPPIPAHPLPPIGPTRRVRELRLDLRTLDAAALFALETWRREVLGLEKMDMDLPDSIWYKDATPTPSPPPASQITTTLTVNGKKRGRPRKDRSFEARLQSEPIIVDDDEVREKILGVPQEDVDQPVELIATVEQATKLSDTLINELRQSADFPEEGAKPQEGPVNESGSVETIIVDVDKTENEPLDSDDNTGPQPIDAVLELSGDTIDEAGPSISTPQRSRTPTSPPPTDTPSPDIFLHDAFNEKEDDDPDFVPPPEAPARRRSGRSPGRPRKNPIVAALPSEETEKEKERLIVPDAEPENNVLGDETKARPSVAKMVSFDLTPIETVALDFEERVQAKTVTFAENLAGPSRKRRSRSRTDDDSLDANAEAGPTNTGRTTPPSVSPSVDHESTPILLTDDLAPELRGIAYTPEATPSPLSHPSVHPSSILKNARRSISTDLSPKPINDASPICNVSVPRTPARKPRNSTGRGSGKRKMVVEIPSASKKVKLAKDDQDSEEDEEWGFLKAFG